MYGCLLLDQLGGGPRMASSIGLVRPPLSLSHTPLFACENLRWFRVALAAPSQSTFQAHVGKIRSEAEAHRVLQYLLMNNKIARATHNMWAFRVWDETKNAQVNGT